MKKIGFTLCLILLLILILVLYSVHFGNVSRNNIVRTNAHPNDELQDNLLTMTDTADRVDSIFTATPQMLTRASAEASLIPLTINTTSTLTYESSEKYLTERLATNGNCELPCFIGIEPGKTKSEEFEQFLQYVNLKVSRSVRAEGSYIYSGFSTRHIDIPVGFELFEKNDIITNAYVEISLENDFDFNLYNLSSVLSNFGSPPSNVYLNIYFSGEPSEVAAYYLLVMYEQYNTWLIYSGSNVLIKPVLEICPFSSNGDGISNIAMALGDPDSEYGKQMSILLFSGTQEIEKVSNFSVDSFYQTFVDGIASDCIQTPLEYW
jgi:hypothetical protein